MTDLPDPTTMSDPVQSMRAAADLLESCSDEAVRQSGITREEAMRRMHLVHKTLWALFQDLSLLLPPAGGGKKRS